MFRSERQRRLETNPGDFSTRHLQRAVSFLWLLLAVPTAWTSTGWMSWAAAAAYLASFLATWLPVRWAGWAWAIACIIGLTLTMPERWAASPSTEEVGGWRTSLLITFQRASSG